MLDFLCRKYSQKRKSSALAAHVDYYIVTFTLEEYYGVNFEYWSRLDHLITGMIFYTITEEHHYYTVIVNM